MAREAMERRVQNVERRLVAVEQILPTLATKADLKAAIETAVEPLPTREEMRAEIQAAIAPLATKAEVRAEGIETRRHFDVVAEGLRADIRMIAEGIVATQARCDARHNAATGTLAQHDRRLTRLEAPPKPK